MPTQRSSSAGWEVAALGAAGGTGAEVIAAAPTESQPPPLRRDASSPPIAHNDDEQRCIHQDRQSERKPETRAKFRVTDDTESPVAKRVIYFATKSRVICHGRRTDCSFKTDPRISRGIPLRVQRPYWPPNRVGPDVVRKHTERARHIAHSIPMPCR